MKPGEAAQVSIAWAANGNGLGPSYAWVSGYTFVHSEGNGNVIVERTKGTFAGCQVRYARASVRKDLSPCKNQSA